MLLLSQNNCERFENVKNTAGVLEYYDPILFIVMN